VNASAIFDGAGFPVLRLTDGVSHWHQFFERALLHGAFSFVMNQQGALLGLLLGMPAYFNQRIDNVVESIDIIVENDQIVLIRVNYIFKDVNLLFLISLHRTFGCGFLQIYEKIADFLSIPTSEKCSFFNGFFASQPGFYEKKPTFSLQFTAKPTINLQETIRKIRTVYGKWHRCDYFFR
jgi:hypothetical protein